MLASGTRHRELWAGWKVGDALAVRHTLRGLRNNLDAALVLLARHENVVDLVGDADARPPLLARLVDCAAPSMTTARAHDGERRSYAVARVRPGFGLPVLRLVVADPLPAELPHVVDTLCPVIEQLEDRVLEASWPSRGIATCR